MKTEFIYCYVDNMGKGKHHQVAKDFCPRPGKEEEKDNVSEWIVMAALALGLSGLMWR